MDSHIQKENIEFDSFSRKFLENGYVIQPILDYNALDKIRNTIIEIAIGILEINYPKDKEFF